MPKMRRLWPGSPKSPTQPSAADRNNERCQSPSHRQAAADGHSKEGSCSYEPTSSHSTNDQHNAHTPSLSGTLKPQLTSFPFMKLPAELRELVYYFAAQPISPLDTGAIPGTPDRVRIPAIAQTSTQLRDEALHVLFKNRPAEVRMHSAYSFNRATDWAVKCSGHSTSFGIIDFKGRLEQARNDYFHVTLDISDEAPYYQVVTKRCASPEADRITRQIKNKLLEFLRDHTKADDGQQGRLSGDIIAGLILLVDEASRMDPPSQGSLIVVTCT